MICTVAATLLGTAVLLAGAMVLLNRPDWWKGLAGATVISVLSAVISLPPLLIGLRYGLNGGLIGALAAAALRAIVSIGLALVAVKASNYPKVPTLLLMATYYVAILAAESSALAFAMRNLEPVREPSKA